MLKKEGQELKELNKPFIIILIQEILKPRDNRIKNAFKSMMPVLALMPQSYRSGYKQYIKQRII